VFGFMGQWLRVNLTTGQIATEPVPSDLARLYIGGGGLAARILYDETDVAIDPLGPDNRLIFMTGPLTGTRVPTSSRHAVVARSPLTGIYGESDSGGSWGVALKAAGFDGVIFEGQSPEPVYLLVHGGEAQLLPAASLWGQDTYRTDELLKAAHSERCVTSCIGPAGERLIPFASIMNDGRHARAAGRAGMGAVMGSKRLKAVVALGSRKPSVADDAALLESVRRLSPQIRQGRAQLSRFGTAGGVVTNAALGDMPAGNWRVGDWIRGAENLSGERMAETILAGRYHCWGCPIGCGRNVRITDGPHAGVDGAGPEYEALAGLGALSLVDDLNAVAHANELCNRYGMDVISTGNVIAFALEAHERGIVESPPDVPLEWGGADTVLALIEQIAERQGLGEWLSLGVRGAAEHFGLADSDLAIHVKGLEPAFHDPRALASLVVAYATHPRGACHRGNSHGLERQALPELGYPKPLDRFAVEGKGAVTALMQDYMALFDSLKLCQFIFASVQVSDVVGWLNAVTGWEMSLDEFLRAGERLSNLKRMYNVRLGISRKDDSLPSRFLHQSLAKGGTRGFLPPLEPMLQEYYAYRGWNSDGVPTSEKLHEIGLDQEKGDLP
jgi:aldehyde:ferredoxin oxidoreductase